MLEDELEYVLSRDCEIKQLIVVESRYNFGFLRKLRSGNCVFRTVSLDRVQILLKDKFSPDFKTFTRVLAFLLFIEKIYEKIESKAGKRVGKRVSVVINLLRLGLHGDLELLKSEVYRNIREMVQFFDGILIF
jgi:hypothetical protein